MDPWIVLLEIMLIALVFVVAPVGAIAFASWRRPVRLTCPRTGTEAQVSVSAPAAAVAALFGRTAGIERCSLPHFARGCREECLALPESARRPVPAGTPPPRPTTATNGPTILVPLDGQPGSEEVLPFVADLARRQAATVRLVHVVVPPRALRSDDGAQVVLFADQEAVRLEEAARSYLSDVARRRLPGVTVASTVRLNDPITGIVAEAEAVGADLIAMAGHRRHPLTGLLRRSVAAGLRRATRIPTLVVPYGERSAA